MPEYIKPQKLNVQQIGTSLAAVNSPLTEIAFGDGNWVSNFTLPTTANDRDRIIIKSTATWSVKINNTNVNSQATLTLKTGDQYEFMYISDKGYWQLISSPTKVIDSTATIPAILPNMTQPTLKVKLSTSTGSRPCSYQLKLKSEIRWLLCRMHRPTPILMLLMVCRQQLKMVKTAVLSTPLKVGQ